MYWVVQDDECGPTVLDLKYDEEHILSAHVFFARLMMYAFQVSNLQRAVPASLSVLRNTFFAHALAYFSCESCMKTNCWKPWSNLWHFLLLSAHYVYPDSKARGFWGPNSPFQSPQWCKKEPNAPMTYFSLKVNARQRYKWEMRGENVPTANTRFSAMLGSKNIAAGWPQRNRHCNRNQHKHLRVQSPREGRIVINKARKVIAGKNVSHTNIRWVRSVRIR